MNCIYKVKVEELSKKVYLIRGRLMNEFELKEGWIDKVVEEIRRNLQLQFR